MIPLRVVSLGLAVLGAATGPGAVAPTVAAGEDPPRRWAELTVTDSGFTLRAGLQDSRLTLSLTDAGQLRVTDPGTLQWRVLDPACTALAEPGQVGIAAECPLPSPAGPGGLRVLIAPRLGDDVVDTTALPARIGVTVLADAGDDVLLLGPGPDVVNGALGDDVVRTGAGPDLVRTGPGADDIDGGPGRDRLLGLEDDDVVVGGPGRDEVDGGPGDDVLDTLDGGVDIARGGPGTDTVHSDPTDRVRTAEAVDHTPAPPAVDG